MSIATNISGNSSDDTIQHVQMPPVHLAATELGPSTSGLPAVQSVYTVPDITDEGQIDWKQGSAYRAIYKAVSDLRKQLTSLRQTHLEAAPTAALITNFNKVMAKLQMVVDYVKITENSPYGWETVQRATAMPSTAHPDLLGKVKVDNAELAKEQKKKENKDRNSGWPFRGKFSGGAATTVYQRFQPYPQYQFTPRAFFGQQQARFGAQLQQFAGSYQQRGGTRNATCYMCGMCGKLSHFSSTCPDREQKKSA